MLVVKNFALFAENSVIKTILMIYSLEFISANKVIKLLVLVETNYIGPIWLFLWDVINSKMKTKYITKVRV